MKLIEYVHIFLFNFRKVIKIFFNDPKPIYVEADPSLMANLKHENIIKFCEYFIDNLLLYMVFEYCEVYILEQNSQFI